MLSIGTSVGIITASLSLSCCPFLCAQQPTSSSDGTITLQARARIVLVDVVVTDAAKHPVHGLTRDQFTLLEDHHPQPLKAFEEHTPPNSNDLAKFPALPKLPPGIFTNYVPAPPDSGPLNVILLDTLNTPITDQQFVRSQLLDYLKHEPAGTRVAIFGLSSKLVMLQGFTSDPNLLREVISRQHGKGSILLDNTVGGEGTPDSLSDFVATTAPPAAPGAGLENTGPSSTDLTANLKTFEATTDAFQLELRIRYTLDALNQLARYLANLPGRKNLIWFSGSFPLNVLPNSTGEDPFAAVRSNEQEYRETTNLLTRSQVAVYPVDARGLQTAPMYNAAQRGTRYSANPATFTSDLEKFNQTNAAEHQTMSAMAQDTGGQAFFNTNGLASAVSQAIDDGSSYYTLAYTPTDPKYSGQFRKIEVKLAQQGYTLSYRRGYYADDPNAALKIIPTTASSAAAITDPNAVVGESLMQKAMQHGVPGGTQIVFTVRALPDPAPDTNTLAPSNIANRPGFLPIHPPYRRYRIDFGTDPSNIVFTRAPDGRYLANIEFDCFLYNPDGEVLNSVSNTIALDLPPARYAALLKSGGITFHQEISAPAHGDFSLRTGVHDLTSNHIGSTEFPLNLVNNLAPLPAPPK